MDAIKVSFPAANVETPSVAGVYLLTRRQKVYNRRWISLEPPGQVF